MKGKLIVVEGPDGAGKATQTRLLAQALVARGERVRTVSFPNYESPACGPVTMYLHGAFGSAPGDVNAYAASTFFAVDRYASYKTDWGEFYRSGGTILADRYTVANAIHQCCKLPRKEWDAFLQWLFQFEYEIMGIPAPDFVIYLDMSPEVSQVLMSKRYGGHEEEKDIHEKDRAYQAAARAAGAYCVEKFGWARIACDDGEKPLAIEEIAAKVLAAVPPEVG